MEAAWTAPRYPHPMTEIFTTCSVPCAEKGGRLPLRVFPRHDRRSHPGYEDRMLRGVDQPMTCDWDEPVPYQCVTVRKHYVATPRLRNEEARATGLGRPNYLTRHAMIASTRGTWRPTTTFFGSSARHANVGL